MTTIQERLRSLGRQLEVMVTEGSTHAQTPLEAANVIDGLVGVVKDADAAISASYKKAYAEWQDMPCRESQCDAVLQEWRKRRDTALASLQSNTEGES